MNLSADKAEAARRAYEEFVDNIAILGDADKGITGLVNNADVTATDAAPNDGGAGGVGATSSAWADKTADEIVADVNDALSGIWSDSLQVEMANTVLLPVAEMARIATMARGTGTDTSVLAWLKANNVYTLTTGQPLTIRAVRGLEGVGSGRMVVYRKDPQVLKLHIPMPHRFMPAWQTGPITYDVPGIFRLAGVDVRRPGAMRYIDGLVTDVYV
jgi:hypothetical protein